MSRTLSISPEVFELTKPFRIARGTRSSAEVVAVAITQGGVTGRGECTPYPRYGESVSGTIAELEACRDLIAAGADRAALALHLGPGAARNALDCALWDLDAKLSGASVASQTGLRPVREAITAVTVSIDTPGAMRSAAAELGDVPLVKVKVDASSPMEAVAAVRAACPNARMIVDANESWSPEQLRTYQDDLAALKVDLLEQPIPADASEALRGMQRLVPICADEAVHTSDDVASLIGLYDFVNIKLDKTGGLTEGLRLADAARAAGLGVMVGCMLGSSLAMAPAMLLSQLATFSDLDGPILFARDREHGLVYASGRVTARQVAIWGEP